MKKNNKSEATILREKAEDLLKKKSSKSGSLISESEMQKLIHELEVIRISADEISEFAENIINTVREPLLALDHDLRVVKASRSFYDFFKVTPDETIGTLIYDLGNHQWNIPKLRELLETILPEKATFDNYEVEHEFSTIGKRIMLLNARQIKRGTGKEKVILLAIEDITERKEVEEKIKHKNEELQNLNTEKDKFFSIIAHDLRSPLSSFLGFTQLLVEELPSMELADLQEMAVSMEKSASNLYRLIENLLEWAKMQRGLVPFKPEAIQINSLVGESVEMLMESVKNKKIDITYDISDDIIVIADANMLKTIIRNFVSNAVKFSSREGKINISAKTSGSESIEIFIQDSGIGMSPAMLDHLFQLNNQTNRIGTEGEPSSGLGLLLCKEFIEKLGGQIRVESEVGKGTEFNFMLPRPVGKEENKVPEKVGLVDQVKIPVKNLKILIADDDIASEMIIALIIRGFGKEILKVRTGTEAVKACRNNPDIDLVLMDIQMPEMDGYEATRQIRKFNKDVIIVAQAGFVTDNDKELAIGAGCNDYISKPIKKAELLGLVQKYFTK